LPASVGPESVASWFGHLPCVCPCAGPGPGAPGAGPRVCWFRSTGGAWDGARAFRCARKSPGRRRTNAQRPGAAPLDAPGPPSTGPGRRWAVRPGRPGQLRDRGPVCRPPFTASGRLFTFGPDSGTDCGEHRPTPTRPARRGKRICR
jgi:hypothetical protein